MPQQPSPRPFCFSFMIVVVRPSSHMSQQSVDELDADELHTFLSKQWPKAQQVIDQLKQNGITGLALTAVEKPDLLECGFSMADALAVLAMRKKLLSTQTHENKSSDPGTIRSCALRVLLSSGTCCLSVPIRWVVCCDVVM
jgi:hypothetical protein